MRSRFVNGMLIGAIGGTILGLMYGPQFKVDSKRTLMGRTRRIGRKTGMIVKELAQDVHGWMDSK